MNNNQNKKKSAVSNISEARGKSGKSSRNEEKSAENKTNIQADNTPRWRPELAFTENKFYTAISKKCHKYKIITIICTIVFVLGMVTVFGSEITVENFKYLIKDLDISSLKGSASYSKIIYDGATSTEFGMFKGDLTVVGSGSSNLYNMSGSSVFTKTNSFYEPVLLTSDKYFLVYDKGDTSYTYTVYNAFSELKTEKMDYPIGYASLADNGSYAIVTRSSDYKGVVYIYNSSFEIICKIQKDKYIMNCQLRSDGKKALVLSAYDNAGDWVCEIMTCDVTSGATDSTNTVEGEIVLKAGYHDDGSFSVMTNKSILFYNESGEQILKYDLGGNTPICCEFDGGYTFLAYNYNVIGTDKAVIIFDNGGNKTYDGTHTGEITNALFDKEYCYILFDEKVERINISNKEIKTIQIDSNCLDFVNTETGYLLLCYSGVANPVTFEETVESQTVTETAQP